MKILKNKLISLFIKSFKIENKTYLVCSSFIFFDLINPENILTEQELWKNLPTLLKDKPVIDMGLPKPRGEVLLTGNCYAPNQKETSVLEVILKVGSINKTLTVFGDRYWQPSPLGWKISEAIPFTKMDISWENAFGGKDYKKNPLGKGIDKVILPNGKEVIPLPNVEDPKQLIVSIEDRPKPASFGPIDIMWPQRFNKQGSYDDKWLKERWPYFPEDMNYEFFNMAPKDQFLEDFFTGKEKITLTNMHPQIPVIKSKLPEIRVRCFVTKIKYSEQDRSKEEFVEVKNKLDTLWLFPEIERGLLIYRGLTEIEDEEFRDVKYIYLAQEKLQEEPKPVSYYFEEQKRKLSRAVDIDMAPFEKAQKEIAKTLKKIKSLPKKIEDAKLKAMGKAPKMTYTLQEKEEKQLQRIQQFRQQIDELEILAQNMHSKWGHLVEIPLNIFANLRDKLAKTEIKTKKIFSSIKQKKKNAFESLKKVKQDLQDLKDKHKNLPKEQLQALDKELDLDSILEKTPPANPWHNQGFPLIVSWRKNLEHNKKAQDILISMGLEKETIKKAWLGLNQEEIKEELDRWEVKDKKEVIIPKGLVIPRFKEATLTGFTIRRSNWSSFIDDFLMPGSNSTPLFLPAVDTENPPVIIIEDELAAYLLEQEVGDACSILVLKNVEETEKLKESIQKAIDSSTSLLIAVPKNYPESKLKSWTNKYPRIKKLEFPLGDNLFELPQKNIDIRNWIMEALPKDFAKKHNINITLPESGKSPQESPLKDINLSIPNIKGIIKSVQQDFKAFQQPKIDKLISKKIKTEQETEIIKKELAQKLEKIGGDPKEVLAPKDTKPTDLKELGKNIAKAITSQKEDLKSQNQLTPEIEAKLEENARQATLMGEDAAQKYSTGKKRIAQAKKKIANLKSSKTIEEFKDKFKAKGINPDRLKPLSRKEVIEKYQKNKNLSHSMLAGLDLSGLDLAGVDLTGAICSNTNFSNCNLTNATFKKTVADKANFSQAILEEAKIEKSIFSSAAFENTNFKGCTIYMSIIKRANLVNTDLTEATIKMSSLQEVELTKSNLYKAKIYMSSISKSNLNKTNFFQSKISKSILQENILDEASFSEILLENSIFTNSKGKSISFKNSKLNNIRTALNTEFISPDFTETKINNGCFRNTKLNKANFAGSTIESTIFEECELRESNFFCVPAKRSRFIKCNLEKANLRGINLFQGSLRKTRLVHTDLRDSNLFAVDFYKAIMGKTRIERANIKRTFLEDKTELLEDGELSD